MGFPAQSRRVNEIIRIYNETIRTIVRKSASTTHGATIHQEETRPRKATGRPTDSELAILAVLWEQGPRTVREVYEILGEGVGYTTVLKLMQIMAEKGLVTRNESQRAHVYAAAKSSEETQGNLVGDLITRAFDGSAAQLVLRALSSRRTSSDELAEIRRLLDDLEDDRKKDGKDQGS